MKTIGLIGGMSWESSKVYYELINERTRDLLGGFHSSKCLLYSVDFADIEALQQTESWNQLDDLMADAANKLQIAGADVIILCTNTMHLCSDAIKANISVPFIHIAQATGERIVAAGLRKVALLGTKITMEKDFYKSVLRSEYGIEVIVPSISDMEIVNTIIFDELVLGKINPTSKSELLNIIEKLKLQGAEGAILGCTELPLLISQNDTSIHIFDTSRIHAEKAVDWVIENI